ncbi:MAG TPA: succinylglutamate desuccinylase, partial [Spirochaetia bacterium]|nr:succinylglutamate desuccinylase [Spirochaetia bacterium]
TMLGVLGPDKEQAAIKTPRESDSGRIHHVHAQAPGLFVPAIEHWHEARAGQLLGEIRSAHTGAVLSAVASPAEGIVFTLREYPVVMEGSLVARLFQPARGTGRR